MTCVEQESILSIKRHLISAKHTNVNFLYDALCELWFIPTEGEN